MSIVPDINNPYCPDDVVHSHVAALIKAIYSESSREVNPPPDLQQFLDKTSCESGLQWENEVLRQLDSTDIPVELLEKWLAVFPSAFFRAQVRRLIVNRKSL